MHRTATLGTSQTYSIMSLACSKKLRHLQGWVLQMLSLVFVVLKAELLQDASVNKGKLAGGVFPICEQARRRKCDSVNQTMPAKQLEELTRGNY